MKRKYLISCILLLFALTGLHAQKLSCHLEWGMTGTVYSHHSSDYTTLEGYHMDPRYYDNIFHPHGFVSVQAGIRPVRRLRLDLCTGYYGLQYEVRSIPVGLRGTWHFGQDPDGKGMLGYAEAGVGFSEDLRGKNADYSRFGIGYRVPLGEGIFLKFLCSGQLSLTHPIPYDYFDDMYVDPSRLIRSERVSLGVSFSMAIGF